MPRRYQYPIAGHEGTNAGHQMPEIYRRVAHGFEDTPRVISGVAVRTQAANLRWLDEGFAYAKRVGAPGVMVIFQADLNFNNEAGERRPEVISRPRARTCGSS